MIELAKKINRKGDLYIKNKGIKDFHKVATDLLGSVDLVSHFNYQEIIEHTFANNSVQNFKNLEFSDLPVTIARGENCFIDLYFWRRRPTVIHNHHFSGAFMCLMGQNLDLEFKFIKKQKLGRFHDLGELKLLDTRKLLPGNIVTIAPMDKFIHQNHHQADLTVNLCFRTPQDTKKNLSNYLFSGLRYEKSPDLLGRVSRLQRFLHIGDFNYSKLQLNSDDAINFLIQTYNSESLNPRLHKMREYLNQKIKKEFKLDITKLMKEHDVEFDRMLDEYE